jgi:hypothetical protein
LGDSIFGFTDHSGVELRFGAHDGPQIVYLEPEVIANFVAWVERLAMIDTPTDPFADLGDSIFGFSDPSGVELCFGAHDGPLIVSFQPEVLESFIEWVERLGPI